MELTPHIPDPHRSPEAEAFEEYRLTRSNQAFERLVRHYADLVYASALRQLRDRHRAEDAVQVVFTVLALKGHKLRPGTLLAPWLLKVTRYTALDARRRRQRRERHERIGQQVRDEQKAAEMSSDNDIAIDAEGGGDDPLRAALDEGIATLSASERAAVVLRYFQGKSHLDVAGALGIGEEAARKRVQRGLEKLRAFFIARGAVVPGASVSGVASAVATHALATAPPSLVGHIAAHAPLTAGGVPSALATQAVVHSAKGVITLMAWTQIKFSLIAVLVVILLAGGGAVAVHALTSPAHDVVVTIDPSNKAMAPAVNSPSPSGGFDPAASSYSLAPGEVLKRIAKPDPAARARLSAFQAAQRPTSITVEWDGKPHLRSQTFGGQGQSLEGMLTAVVGLSSFDFTVERNLPDRGLSGDWVIRKGATPDQLIAALQTVLREQGRPVYFEKRRVKREVIMVGGTFLFRPVADPHWSKSVNVYCDKLNPPGIGGGGERGLHEFLNDLGNFLGRRVLDQSSPTRARFEWRFHDDGDLRFLPAGPRVQSKLDRILANLSRQTGLAFKKTDADEAVWFVTRAALPQAGH